MEAFSSSAAYPEGASFEPPSHVKGLTVELPGDSELAAGIASASEPSPSLSSPSFPPSSHSWDSVLMHCNPPPNPPPKKRSPQLRRSFCQSLCSAPTSPTPAPYRHHSLPLRPSPIESLVAVQTHSYSSYGEDSPSLHSLSNSVHDVLMERQQASGTSWGRPEAASHQQHSAVVEGLQQSDGSGQRRRGQDAPLVEEWRDEMQVQQKVSAVVMASPAELLSKPMQSAQQKSSLYNSIHLSPRPQLSQRSAAQLANSVASTSGAPGQRLAPFCPPLEIPPTPAHPSPSTTNSSQNPSSASQGASGSSDHINSPAFDPLTPNLPPHLPYALRPTKSPQLQQPSTQFSAVPQPSIAQGPVYQTSAMEYHHSGGSEQLSAKHWARASKQASRVDMVEQKLAQWQQSLLEEQRWQEERERAFQLQQEERARQHDQQELRWREQESPRELQEAKKQQQHLREQEALRRQQEAMQQQILEQQQLIYQLQNERREKERFPEPLVVPALCPVCDESLGCGRAVFAPECGHFVHFDCIREQLRVGQSMCPTCQKRIEQKPYLRTPPPSKPSSFGTPVPMDVESSWRSPLRPSPSRAMRRERQQGVDGPSLGGKVESWEGRPASVGDFVETRNDFLRR